MLLYYIGNMCMNIVHDHFCRSTPAPPAFPTDGLFGKDTTIMEAINRGIIVPLLMTPLWLVVTVAGPICMSVYYIICYICCGCLCGASGKYTTYRPRSTT